MDGGARTVLGWWPSSGAHTDLYSETPTRPEVHVNDRVRYTYCVMDALAAVVVEEQATVTVRSIDRVADTSVTFTVSDDAAEVSPEEALTCFGSRVGTEDVEAVGPLAAWSMQDDKSDIQTSVCQYTAAFESKATYEQWASGTESVSAPLPPAKVVRLLQKPPTASGATGEDI